MANVSRVFTSIEIHPAVIVDEGFFIDHGSGLVIGETAVIGRLSPNGGANGVTGLRYSFAGNQAASIGSIRLNHFYAADYAMGDNRDYGGAYGIDKYYDGRHHATLRPVVSGGADLGTDSKRYGNSYIDSLRP